MNLKPEDKFTVGIVIAVLLVLALIGMPMLRHM